MVLSSLWGAELLFLGGQASTRSQTPAEVCREQGFTKCRDLLGTDICRTWVCRGQYFSGAEVCRVAASFHQARPQRCVLGS